MFRLMDRAGLELGPIVKFGVIEHEELFSRMMPSDVICPMDQISYVRSVFTCYKSLPTTRKWDVGAESQHFVALFRLCNPHNQSTDFNIKRRVQDGLKILYQQNKGNEDNDWPYEGGCQKLSSEILCAH
jgi:hypothetical protein